MIRRLAVHARACVRAGVRVHACVSGTCLNELPQRAALGEEVRQFPDRSVPSSNYRHDSNALSTLQSQSQPLVQGAHLASCMLHTACQNGDIEGRTVLDLGCGTGVLTIGAALGGAGFVIGVDVDTDAMDVAKENVAIFDGDDEEEEMLIDFVQADLRTGALAPHQNQQDDRGMTMSGSWGGLECLARLRPDTVIMNPPFGTKTSGADRVFLEAAFRMLRAGGGGVIYSLHKSSTRQFIERISRELGGPGCACRVVAEMRYELPKTYRFHRKDSVDIKVDFW